MINKTIENLRRYSKICDKCAEEKKGECHKTVVCYTLINCEICGKERACLSVRDYVFPEVN